VVQVTDVSGFREFGHAGRPVQYDLVTLFPSVIHSNLPATRLRDAVWLALDQLAPTAVVVPGWAGVLAQAALGWAVRNHVPRVLISETQKQDHPRRFAKEWVKRRLVGLFGSALCGGTRHAEYLCELGMPADRIFLGYDAVDNEYFAAGADAARRNSDLRTRLGLPSAYLLASARFIPKKNLDGLLVGYAEYRRRVGEEAWDLVLLGDGPERPNLEALRAELGLNRVVHLPGYRGYDMLPAFYGLAEGFVHASTIEPWGLVVNEAAAVGLPVVVSDRCGAVADLVRDGKTGFLFDPTSPGALGLRLTELHRHPDRPAMGEAGCQLVAGWGPNRFGAGLAGALAAAVPVRRSGLIARAVLRATATRTPSSE